MFRWDTQRYCGENYQEYRNNCCETTQRICWAETVKSDIKQQLPFFRKRRTKFCSHSQLEVADLKVDRDLTSRVYISCQSMVMNLDVIFFKHENHPHPQSPSDHGELRGNNKCYLVACLEVFTTPSSDPPAVYSIILDGAAAVYLLDPRTFQTFSDYADTVFLPYIDRHDAQLQLHDTTWCGVGYIHSWQSKVANLRIKGEMQYGGGCLVSEHPRQLEGVFPCWRKWGRTVWVPHEWSDEEILRKLGVYATDKDSVLYTHQDADTDNNSPWMQSRKGWFQSHHQCLWCC